VGAEEAARAAKRGLWGGSFETPADWRKERCAEFTKYPKWCLTRTPRFQAINSELSCVRQS